MVKDLLSERYTEDIDMRYESLTFVKEKDPDLIKKQKPTVETNDLYR